MIEKLKASVRDIVLAAVAAFTASFSTSLALFLESDEPVSLPGLKAFALAAIVTAGYAALRAGVGAIAARRS